MYGPLYERQPRELNIETLTLCNAACEFCPYPTLERKGTMMATDDVYALLNQTKTWRAPFFISPFKVNEPFLDSRLETFCRYIDREIPNARLRLFSNGTPLTHRQLQWVSQLSRVEHLWISLNEYDLEKYEQVMKLEFYKTLTRLDHLHHLKSEGEFPHKVVVSRVSDFSDLIEDQKFRDYCFSRWPRFAVMLIKRDAWIDYTHAAEKTVPLSPCGRWFELNICADGKVALCCMDGKADYAIGNIHQSSLLDIYNQNVLLTRRRVAASRRGIEPCERCTY